MFQSPAALFTLCLALAHVNAHFLLNYPTTVGFVDDDEGKAPCGGFEVTFDNSTNFYVGGDAIALTSTHPASTWLFRATLDQKAAGNWSVLLPAIAQASLGNFCEQGVTVPASFAGQKGVIQVIEDAVDGQLFQCAAVNFVSGVNPSVPSSCQNATGLQASFTSDPALSTIAGAAPTGSGAPATGSSAAATGSGAAASTAGSSTASAATPSASKSASASPVSGYATGSLFWGAVVALGSVVVAFGL